MLSDNAIIWGNINIINKMEFKDDNYIILDNSAVSTDNMDNTVYFKSDELSHKEKAVLLKDKKTIVCQNDYSVKDIINGRAFVNSELSFMERRIIVPLFYLRTINGHINIYSQLRFSKNDIIFIKTGICENDDINSIIQKAIMLHKDNFVFLGNHQCYYRKMDSAKEIEYKFNINDASDPWVMINDIFDEVTDGKLENYIFEYKDDFQKWDYMNYMFKINGDESEKGYISFIPQTNGKYLVKRKIYQYDQISRTEIHYKNMDVKCPLHDFIENYFGLHDYVEFPPFRRVRYDINIENYKTGNVHGIFFDYITVEGHDNVLKQCEIEYLRTRALFDNDEYQNELVYLKNYMIDFFKRKNIEYTETFYSKLSFMDDVCK